jgi:hypothetical protein
VHGTPERFSGSVAEAVLEIARTHQNVLRLAMSEFDVLEVESLGRPATTIILRVNPTPKLQSQSMVFAGFSASYEGDAVKKKRCSSLYRPLLEWVPATRIADHLPTLKLAEIEDAVNERLSSGDFQHGTNGEVLVTSDAFYALLAHLRTQRESRLGLGPKLRDSTPAKQLLNGPDPESATTRSPLFLTRRRSMQRAQTLNRSKSRFPQRIATPRSTEQALRYPTSISALRIRIQRSCDAFLCWTMAAPPTSRSR